MPLTLVPTPIGNMEDITLRAIRMLREADIILAEDTRTSRPLLEKLEVTRPTLIPFHQHNEHQALQGVLKMLSEGKKVCLISDAGTPGISDPGFLLVREAIEAGFQVETLPGATAFVPALVNSGFPSDKFVFEGFLPLKKGRQTRLKILAEEQRTMVLYESPHRLLKTLEQLIEVMEPERMACVSRELTKMFEENARGSLAELLAYFQSKPIKGEIVLVIAGKDS